MDDIFVLVRWADGAAGLTGWGIFYLFLMCLWLGSGRRG